MAKKADPITYIEKFLDTQSLEVLELVYRRMQSYVRGRRASVSNGQATVPVPSTSTDPAAATQGS